MTDDHEARPILTGRAATLALLGGVVLPALTVLVESVSGICAAALFDPLPTPVHLALAASVPAAQLAVWRALRRGRPSRRHGLLAGWALGIASVYTLFFLPTLPLAVPGILAFGLGLLPLAPLLATLSALGMRRALRAAPLAGGAPRLWPGAALALAVLVAADVPRTVTRVGLDWAVAEDAGVRQRGLAWLRRLGSERELLRRCYPRWGASIDLLGVFWVWRTPVSTDQARDVWYRVTGRAFNDEPRPRFGPGDLAPWRDRDQAAEAVGGRVAGLSLASSRLDGSVDADAALGYLEWTLEIRNETGRPQEARGQVLLPPGSAVSRVTLWIDGEEREAAFGGRGVVREAYRRVVRRRRDPLLVTTAGPDRVLVQCFPVPPGGTMKLRLGITAPLLLREADRGELVLPRLVERNFDAPDRMRHDVWIEAARPLSGAGLTAESGAGGWTLRGALAEGDAWAPASAARDPEARVAAAPDPTEDGSSVVQRIDEAPGAAAARVVVVVDGSAGMAGEGRALASSLARPGVAAILVAGDAVEEADAAVLAARRWVGGADDVPALARAWDLAAAEPGGTVLWIHAPQPVVLSPAAPLRQRFERRPAGPRLVALAVGRGPNRILEQLDGVEAVSAVPRRGTLAEDLDRLFAEWSSGAPRPVARRERVASSAVPAGALGTSGHLVRLWARDEAGRLAARPQTRPDAVALSVAHRLVTPASGAVVLENAQQYEEAGLDPAAPADVPTVPEPETWALLIVATALVAAMLRRRREGLPWIA